MLAVAIVSFLLVIFSSIAILQVERHPDANIQTPEQALWWAFVTITTVRYGDKFPVTTEGRIIAAVLMIGGVVIFGTFTGFVASWFLSPGEENENALVEVRRELAAIRMELDGLTNPRPSETEDNDDGFRTGPDRQGG